MTPIERAVRAEAYRLLILSGSGPTVGELAASLSLPEDDVAGALRGLQDGHLLAISPDGSRVSMAHPFSGVPTGYEAAVGERRWHANCAWDALAILSLLGDGEALVPSGVGGTLRWSVSGGVVTPGGVIHMRVPARNFWDDIGFT